MYIFVQVIPTLHSLVPLIAAIPSSIRHTRSDKFTPLPPSISTLQQEPGRRLSKYASLYFPNISGYINDTERWAAETKSNFSVIVVPAIDRDVAATVKFADIYNIPFLAVNKGHGSAAGLSTAYNGIEIYIRPLDSIQISEDGDSALMGGGVYQVQFANPARALFHDGDIPGQPLNTYVNYASSDETSEMLYGYEPWRLERRGNWGLTME